MQACNGKCKYKITVGVKGSYKVSPESGLWLESSAELTTSHSSFCAQANFKERGAGRRAFG